MATKPLHRTQHPSWLLRPAPPPPTVRNGVVLTQLVGIAMAEQLEGGLGLILAPVPEPAGQSCSGPASDCRAPGYPCSGRGNVCDYLLCKPQSRRRKTRVGGMDGKDSFNGGCVFACALAGGIVCVV